MAQKKITVKPLTEKRAMIDKHSKEMSLSRQCELLDIHRSGLYYTPSVESTENLTLMRKIDEQYFHTPFYGTRKIAEWLKREGHLVNIKRVKRLMSIVGWQTIYRAPNTSWKNKEHKIYPYLLKNEPITHRNQAWAIDITYIPMKTGFMYLCAIIDLHTRFVVAWNVSNTMTAEWCKSVVEEAIEQHGKPRMINSDQGSQFTSHEYTDFLKLQEIQISMDGKGRCIDNIFIERLWKSVKYECVYLRAFTNGTELYNGLKNYFHFYNSERTHQSLGYKTPAEQYKKAA